MDPPVAPAVEHHWVPPPPPPHHSKVPPPPPPHHLEVPPPPPSHHSEAPPPPPPSHVASPPRRRRPVVLAVVTAVAILVLGGAGTAVALVMTRHDAAPTVAAHLQAPGLTPESGAAVFEDDFTDPFSGWPTGPIDPSATATYGIPGYVIDGRGTGPHLAHSPYPRLVQTIGATVKAKVTKGDNTSAVGIRCDQPLVSTFSYSFYVFPDGRFSIVSDTGTPHLPGYEITSGSVPGVKGVNDSNTISAACMNVKTGQGVTVARLMLQVNGTLVSDYTDTLYLNGLGWGASVLSVTAAQQPSQVAFRDFIVRDLTGAKPGECSRAGTC
jgi:hypothetical protein